MILYDRFSTAPIRLAEEPTTSRPNVGASSLFDNISVEAEKTQQQLEQTGEKAVKKQVRKKKKEGKHSHFSNSIIKLYIYNSVCYSITGPQRI